MCETRNLRSLSYSCTYLYHKSSKNPILRTRVKIEQYLPRQQRHLTIISFPHLNSWGSREDAQNNVCADLVLFKKCVRLIIYAQRAIGTLDELQRACFRLLLMIFTEPTAVCCFTQCCRRRIKMQWVFEETASIIHSSPFYYRWYKGRIASFVGTGNLFAAKTFHNLHFLCLHLASEK